MSVGAHHGGPERIESAEAKAQRVVAEEIRRLGWDSLQLQHRRKGDQNKIALARRLRTETTMSWTWIAKRLHMGAAAYAANCVRKASTKVKVTNVRN